MELINQLELLKNKRPIFHSEADFQFSLAWELQTSYPDAEIRLEYCPRQSPNMHIDIVAFVNSRCYPIELKYKTLKLEYTNGEEYFSVKNHGAQDIGRYDCLKDIERIEYLSKVIDNFERGYVVVLSNDPLYWTIPQSQKPTNSDGFRIHDGLIKTGTYCWSDTAGAGTTQGREAPIRLAGEYPVRWREFSRLNDGKNGTFQYTVFTIR